VQNLLQLAVRTSPTTIADTCVDGEDEGLDSVVADPTNHHAYNTREERVMVSDEDMSEDEEVSECEDDDDEMMDCDDTAKDNDDATVDGVARGVSHLSFETLFQNFEESIEWGG
jgi:hypothetical protein